MPQLLETYIQAIAQKYSVTPDYAFEILSIALILDKPFDEVFDDIWTTGSMDGGMDGIYIDSQTNTVNIFQIKNSPSLRETELTALRASYTNIFANGNPENIPLNDRVTAILSEYQDLIQRGKILEPKLIFVYNGQTNDPANANNQALVTRYSGPSVGFPPVTVYDSVDLLSRASSLQKTHRAQVDFVFQAIDTNITPSTGQALFSFYLGDVKAANFRMKAIDLCNLMELEIRTNGTADTLYSENIRGYLGHNKANKGILQTLQDTVKSIFFPFMNNGVTIICETMTIPRGPQANQYNIPTTNPVIVNGLQTSKIIFEVYKSNPTLLDNVFLTVKLYETRNPELIDLITEATNTQTAINYRDQISNKPFNGWTRDFFASKSVKYVSKRGETMRLNDLTVGLQDSVSNDIVLKFWYATFHKGPHVAKTSKTTVLENIFLATKGENPEMGDIFLGDRTSPVYEQMYTAYRIYRIISDKRKEFKDQPGYDYLLHADELIAYAIYIELESLGLLVNPTDQVLQNTYSVVQPRIAQLVTNEKAKRRALYAHTKYFKSESVVEDYDQLRLNPTGGTTQAPLGF